jgi:hypothetical protein
MIRRNRRSALALIVAAGVFACESSTDVETEYRATLSGSSVIPAVQTSATGAVTAVIGPSNVLRYTIDFRDLGSTPVNAHIHGPATASDSAGILVDLATGGRTLVLTATGGMGNGEIDLSQTAAVTATVNTDSLAKLLELGRLYVDVHTASRPAGEIRGQLLRK